MPSPDPPLRRAGSLSELLWEGARGAGFTPSTCLPVSDSLRTPVHTKSEGAEDRKGQWLTGLRRPVWGYSNRSRPPEPPIPSTALHQVRAPRPPPAVRPSHPAVRRAPNRRRSGIPFPTMPELVAHSISPNTRAQYGRRLRQLDEAIGRRPLAEFLASEYVRGMAATTIQPCRPPTSSALAS